MPLGVGDVEVWMVSQGEEIRAADTSLAALSTGTASAVSGLSSHYSHWSGATVPYCSCKSTSAGCPFTILANRASLRCTGYRAITSLTSDRSDICSAAGLQAGSDSQ